MANLYLYNNSFIHARHLYGMDIPMTTHTVRYQMVTEKAWTSCSDCEGNGCYAEQVGDDEWEQVQCERCNGDGGAWHEALECRSSHPEAQAHLTGCDHGRDCWASKDDLLTQLFDCCKECGGKKVRQYHFGDDCKPCTHCLDSNGNPTGAELTTGQGWKVKEEL